MIFFFYPFDSNSGNSTQISCVNAKRDDLRRNSFVPEVVHGIRCYFYFLIVSSHASIVQVNGRGSDEGGASERQLPVRLRPFRADTVKRGVYSFYSCCAV